MEKNEGKKLIVISTSNLTPQKKKKEKKMVTTADIPDKLPFQKDPEKSDEETIIKSEGEKDENTKK